MTNKTVNSKICPICSGTIDINAIKCTHCGSFQNWQRHLNLSSSLLSLVIALISVATVFITVVIDSAREKNSDIKVSLVNWQRTFVTEDYIYQILNVEIFITNAGERPGVIKTVAIKGAGDAEFQHLRSESEVDRFGYSHEEVNAQIVESGKTLLLAKQLNTAITVDEFEEKYTNADLRLQLVNFDGSEQEIVLEIRDNTPEFYY